MEDVRRIWCAHTRVWPRNSSCVRRYSRARSSFWGKIRAPSFGGWECTAFDTNEETYGSRRIRDELAADGVPADELKIATIMREGRLATRGRIRKRGRGSYKGEISRHPGNRARHDFRAGLSNLLRLTDIPQFGIPAGKVHLSPVPGRFDGAIISWAVTTSLGTEMANSMLRDALEMVLKHQRRFLVLCSDCICHHRWLE